MRLVKIKSFANWRPTRPMRMRAMIRAFEEIPAPGCARALCKGSQIGFQKRKRNCVFQIPGIGVVISSVTGPGWNETASSFAPVLAEPCIFFKAVGSARCIFDIIEQHCADAIDFKIQIPLLWIRLYKEFHAAILAYSS